MLQHAVPGLLRASRTRGGPAALRARHLAGAAQENTLGQKFIVDALLYCDLRPAGLSDDLTQTVNYAEVYSDIKAIVEGPPCTLLESVAEKIASRTLDNNPPVSSITVTVRKPHVAVVGPVDYLGIQIHRVRATDSSAGP